MKYKNKYNLLRNSTKIDKYNKQQGGSNPILENWTLVNNNGQHNCGIYTHASDTTLIMKCVLGTNCKTPEWDDVNSKSHIFPIIKDKKIDQKTQKCFIIMERFDGDITSIYFNLLPDMVLKSISKDNETIRQMKQLFDIKTPATMNPIIPVAQRTNILASINRSGTILTDKLYKQFIERLTQEWQKYHIIITNEIVRVLLKLLELDYYYNDMKFDNFAYKLSDTIIEDDFRKDNVPKIFNNKYFYVYIIDPESGLHSLHNSIKYQVETVTPEIRETIPPIINKNACKYLIYCEKTQQIKKILKLCTEKFNLSVHGQYSLSHITINIDQNQDLYTGDTNKILEYKHRVELPESTEYISKLTLITNLYNNTD